jgi:hypothetical protein
MHGLTVCFRPVDEPEASANLGGERVSVVGVAHAGIVDALDRGCLVAVLVAVHQPSPDRSLAHWLDPPSDLTRTNSTSQHEVDGEHQPTELAVGVEALSKNPPCFGALSGCASGWPDHDSVRNDLGTVMCKPASRGRM